MRRQAAEPRQILPKRALVLGSVIFQRDARATHPFDDLVLHVGDVHHLLHVVAFELEIAPHEIGKNECAEIPNVAKVINGRPAAIHAYLPSAGIERDEVLDRPR